MGQYASWGIIIDDIVFPDGRTVMGVPGGGGLYAAVGMRLWTADVILISAVGRDFEAEVLAQFGLDGHHLLMTDLPTPRAWQLFEENGRRTQVFRVPDDDWYRQLVLPPTRDTIPLGLRAAHFLSRGDPREEEMVLALRQHGVRLSAEPIIDAGITAAEKATLERSLAHIEIFSPGPEETTLLVGEGPIVQQLPALSQLGPRLVALRLGAHGSILYERKADRFWQVPAARASVVDLTGAGNAYCGGLLVGWTTHGDIRRAAAQAAISAATTIAQVGPPPIDDAALALAQTELAAIVEQIRPAKELEKQAGRRA